MWESLPESTRSPGAFDCWTCESPSDASPGDASSGNKGWFAELPCGSRPEVVPGNPPAPMVCGAGTIEREEFSGNAGLIPLACGGTLMSAYITGEVAQSLGRSAELKSRMDGCELSCATGVPLLIGRIMSGLGIRGP